MLLECEVVRMNYSINNAWDEDLREWTVILVKGKAFEWSYGYFSFKETRSVLAYVNLS